MPSAISLLATVVLVSILVAGCGCLAADSYGKPACQKYDTRWPPLITLSTKGIGNGIEWDPVLELGQL
jgi:hypothetical protein